MERALSLEFLRVVENAAIASARTMGLGTRIRLDEVAVRGDAARDGIDGACDGTIVIGEGERDEAPMLYIGERVAARIGWALGAGGRYCGRSAGRDELCATGAPGSITVLAA